MARPVNLPSNEGKSPADPERIKWSTRGRTPVWRRGIYGNKKQVCTKIGNKKAFFVQGHFAAHSSGVRHPDSLLRRSSWHRPKLRNGMKRQKMAGISIPLPSPSASSSPSSSSQRHTEALDRPGGNGRYDCAVNLGCGTAQDRLDAVRQQRNGIGSAAVAIDGISGP